MNNKRQTLKIRKILLFFIGIVSCSDILSAFVVGSTPIMIANVLAFPLLFLCVFHNHGRLVKITHYLTKDLLYLGVFIFLSITQVLIFNPGNVYQWLVGCVSFLLHFFLILSIIESKEEVEALYWGLLIGVIINFLISFYAMILYNSGVILDLAKYFPNEGLIGKMYLSNAFRARGLFREQGHLMRFLAIFAIPLAQFAKSKNMTLFVFYVAAVAFMMAFTGSSSVALFLVGYVAYVFIKNGREATKIVVTSFGGVIIVFVLLYVGRNISFVSKLLTAFQIGVSSIFDISKANLSRVQGMKYALVIIKDYPFVGCGWNNLTKVFMKNGFYGVNNVLGSYSEALSLIAELGFASIFYFYFMISKGYSLIKYRREDAQAGFGVSLLIYFALFCLTDYSIDVSSSVFLALVLLTYGDFRDTIALN